MPILHILNKAPGEPRFDACLADLTAGDSLLLIENAVTATVDSAPSWPDHVQRHVLADDLEARGLTRPAIDSGWHGVDYAGFVRLTTESEKVVCW